MNEFNRSVSGEMLRLRRTLRHLTQAEVAQELGVSQPTYSTWERQRSNSFTPTTIRKLAEVLGTSTEYLQEGQTRKGARRKRDAELVEALRHAIVMLGQPTISPADKLQRLLGALEGVLRAAMDTDSNRDLNGA